MTKIEEFLVKKKELEQLISSFGKTALKELFDKWFEEQPDLYGIGWTQYTPYFNDGEECVFSLSCIGFFFTKEEFESEEDSIYEFDTYSIEDPGRKKKCEAIESELSELEDVLRSVFGDHMKIMVNRDEITSEEYSHD